MKKSFVYYILFGIFALWTAAGAFPLICFEEDSSMLIVSVQHMLDNGWKVSPDLNYCYSTQPLIYYVIAAFATATGAAVDTSYCLLTLIASLILAWITVSFVNRLTGIRREYVLAALFLLPESSAVASYPNSAVFAALFFMAALQLMLKRRYVWATLLLGIAPLLRADVVCVYPVVLPLMLWQGLGGKRSFGYSVFMAAGVCVIYFMLFTAIGIDAPDANATIGEAIESYWQWTNRITRADHYKALLAFYALPGIVLFPWGVVRMCADRKWQLLAIDAVAIVCCHLVFLGMGCAAKHYLYILPFVCMVMSFAIADLARRIKAKSAVAISILAGICLFEVSSVVKIPALQTEEPTTSFLPRHELISFPLGNSVLSVGFGGGHPINTCDEITLLTGQLFFPKFISDYKSRLKEMRTNAIDALPRQCRFLRHGEPNSGLYLLMRNKGYKIIGEDVDMTKYLGETADIYNSRYILKDDMGNIIDDMYITHTPESVAFESEANLDDTDVKLESYAVLFRSAIERVGYEMPTYISSMFKDYSISFTAFDTLVEEGLIEQVADGLWRVCPRSEGVADGEVEGEGVAE